MKILHTGDWHVGKTIQGRTRIHEYEAVLAEITTLARFHSVDLVLVAGDIFDSASPPAEAERIAYRALMDLGEIAPVLVVPGNHDNERRFAAVAPLFEATNVSVQPFITDDGPLEVKTKDGERAQIAFLPWVSQRYIIRAEQLMKMDAAAASGAFAARLRSVIGKLCERFDDDAVRLVIGHVTIASAAAGGGERAAQTLFDYWIDTTCFPSNVHYVALGHIHKMQRMPGQMPVYYSGSPLQLDFSDTDDDRFAILIEATASTPATVTELKLSQGSRLKTVSGTFEQLRGLAGAHEDALLRVIVRDKARVGLGDEVRELFPNAVRVIIESPEDPASAKRAQRKADSSPSELFAQYLSEKNVEDNALLALFKDLYEECV